LHTSARASTSKAAMAAHEVGVVARIERSRSATAWLWGISISIAVLTTSVGLSMLLQRQISTPAVDKGNASAFARDRTASIVLNQGSKDCQHKLFDNQTGRFSDATPCPADVPVDAYGSPAPMGTLHRMKAISDSFR
jgi:hypothetical protein